MPLILSGGRAYRLDHVSLLSVLGLVISNTLAEKLSCRVADQGESTSAEQAPPVGTEGLGSLEVLEYCEAKASTSVVALIILKVGTSSPLPLITFSGAIAAEPS